MVKISQFSSQILKTANIKNILTFHPFTVTVCRLEELPFPVGIAVILVPLHYWNVGWQNRVSTALEERKTTQVKNNTMHCFNVNSNSNVRQPWLCGKDQSHTPPTTLTSQSKSYFLNLKLIQFFFESTFWKSNGRKIIHKELFHVGWGNLTLRDEHLIRDSASLVPDQNIHHPHPM